MNVKDFKHKKLPDSPGVYFFLGLHQQILYIGRATSLRDRVKSYFNKDIVKTRGPIIQKMVHEAVSIDYRGTDSVLEALILEASLIKTHKPLYNSRDKDDKSYNYLLITNEAYPRVLVVRGRELDQKFKAKDIKHVFGPFPEGNLFKEAVRIVRKIFPFGDTCVPFDEVKKSNKNKKPCFNAQIGLCPGVCSGVVTRRTYARTIRNIRLMFEGKKRTLVTMLTKEMALLAKRHAFEEAQKVKQTLYALKHINDVTLLKRDIRELTRGHGIFRIEAYDVAHTGGSKTVGVMVVVENGELKKSDYRKFRIRDTHGINDIRSLEEILRRRFNHAEWRLPNAIVVDGIRTHIQSAKRILHEFGYAIPIVALVKDAYHRPREIYGDNSLVREHEDEIMSANSEAHRFAISYHRTE